MMKDIVEKRIKMICCVIWLLFSLAYIIYCNRVYIELPYLSWFEQIPLADLYYSGRLQISDLFSRYGEQGMLANNVIYLINVVLFHGTALFDVYLNDINVMICGGLLAYGTVKTLGFKPSTIFWVMAESVFMFSLIQGSSGGMDTQVRLGLLFFLLTMWMVDVELVDVHCSWLHCCGTICMIILSINVFGTLYSFAGVPCVWAIILFLQWKGKKVNKNRISIAIVYLLTIPIYLIEYGGIGGVVSDKLDAGKFLLVFMHPAEAVKGMFAWYANGILGWGYHESGAYKAGVFLIVGAVVFLMTVVSVALFFKEKMYTKTWLPLMCIMYSLGVYVLVYLGRATGWEWLSNEWYTVHIKISIAATIWIYGYYCNRGERGKTGGALTICALAIITGIVGNTYTIKRASAVHNYFMEKQKYLYIDNEKDMPVDKEGLTPLLHSLDVTMESINIMKKYNLSVYQYWDAWEKCPTTRLPDNQIKYLSGRYDDGWCEEEMKFSLHTGEISKLEVCYMAQREQNCTIIVNGAIEETIQLKEGEGTFDIPCASNMDMVVSIKSDYSARLTLPDERMASYHLRDIKCVK